MSLEDSPEAAAPAPAAPARPARLLPWAIALGALALVHRLVLIHAFPTLFAWDAFTRLLEPTRLVVRHWMPVPQLPVFLVHAAGGDVDAVRVAYAGVACAALAILGAVVARVHGRGIATASVALVAAVPVFAIHSIVPYQEGALLLFLGAFLWLREPTDAATGRPDAKLREALAAASLAFACLCRYEAWLFAAIFALRPLLARDVRTLRVFAPSALAIAGWLFFLPGIDGVNPLADPAAAVLPPTSGPAEVAASMFGLVIMGLRPWILVFAAFGLAAALRRNDAFGRELPAFALGCFALALARAVHTGAGNQRMALLVVVIALVYAPIGLAWALERANLPRPARRALFAGATALAVGWYGFLTQNELAHLARAFGYERVVALQLESMIDPTNPDQRIGVVPRPIPNPWGESPLKPIFAHSFRLRPDDPRWVLGAERVRAEEHRLHAILYFDPASGAYGVVPGPASVAAR